MLGQAAHAEVERTDFYGDPLPRHAVARLGTVRFRTLTGAFALDLSPDGKLVATGTYPGSLHEEVELWDATRGKKTGSLLAGTSNILGLAFSPDGKRLAVSHDNRLEIFDVVTRKSLARLPRDEDHEKAEFWTLAWSPRGTYLAATITKNGAWLFDAATGKQLHKFSYASGTRCVAFSPDETQLLIGGSSFLQTFNVLTQKLDHSYDVAKKSVQSASVSPDGRSLVVGCSIQEDGEAPDFTRHAIEIWDVDGTKRRTLEGGPERACGRLRFLPDGKTILATGAFAGRLSDSVVAWDVATGKLNYEAKAAGYVGHDLGLSADGRVFAAAGRRIGLWDAATGKPLVEMQSHGREVFRLHLLHDGKTVISGGGDRTLRFWELPSGRLLKTHHVDLSWGGAFAISPDDKLLAVGSEKDETRIRLLDAVSFKELAVLRREKRERASRTWTSAVTSLAFLPGGKLVSAADGSVDVWDVEDRRHLYHLADYSLSLDSLPISSDGKTIALPYRNEEEKPEGDPRFRVAEAQLWDIEKRRPLQKLGATWTVFGAPLAFSPDAKQAVTGFANPGADFEKPEQQTFLRLWDCETGKAVWTSRKTAPNPWALVISPNGKLIASAHWLDQHDIRLWSAADGSELLRLKGHVDLARHLLFTPDSKLLLSASQDSTVLVWDMKPALEKLAK
jgi:WD40 repeat protein